MRARERIILQTPDGPRALFIQYERYAYTEDLAAAFCHISALADALTKGG